MENITGHQTLSAGMAQVSHYFDWIFSEIKSHLGQRVLEIGPGYGNLADRILQSERQYFAVDSDATIMSDLRQRLTLHSDCLVTGNILEPPVAQKLSFLKPDTIVSMNVLEHVEDDQAHLQALSRLAPGGHLILFVPALPFLYGTFDRQAGHFRRYTRNGLLSLLQKIQAETIEVRYFNTLGAVSWWVATRLLRLQMNSESTSGSIIWYDRYIIPWARFIDPWVHGLCGQSLLAFAQLPPKGKEKESSSHESI